MINNILGLLLECVESIQTSYTYIMTNRASDMSPQWSESGDYNGAGFILNHKSRFKNIDILRILIQGFVYMYYHISIDTQVCVVYKSILNLMNMIISVSISGS